MTRPRGNRHRLRGVVVRDKADKTITVEVVRRYRHPRYGKMVRRNSRIAAHDETNAARIGDLVEIVSCRPMSRSKRYRVLRIVERSMVQQLVGQPSDRARPEAEGTLAGAPATPVPEPMAESDEPTPEAGPAEPTAAPEPTEPPAES